MLIKANLDWGVAAKSRSTSDTTSTLQIARPASTSAKIGGPNRVEANDMQRIANRGDIGLELNV